MEQWIEEFLYRGKPPSGPQSDEAPAFHVVIGQQAASPLDTAEKVRKFIGPITLGQAADLGWTFEEIITSINTAAITRVSELEAELAAIKEG